MREGVSLPTVGVVATVALVVTWPAVRHWYLRAGLPPAPSWGAALLLVTAAGVTVLLGRSVRGDPEAASERVAGGIVAPGALSGSTRAGWRNVPGTSGSWRFAVRVLAMAQAAAVTGSVFSGAGLGYVAALAPDLDTRAVRGAAASASVLVLASGVLLGAGLWVQHACRTPVDPPGSE